MKKQNTFTQKDVKNYAIKLQVSTDALMLNRAIRRRLDMRFNFSKAVFDYLKNYPLSEDEKKVILKKRRQRKSNNFKFTNVLSNPIVKDFTNNKNSLIHITDNRLIFIGGRNHWAKNHLDYKILSILKKFK